MTTLYRPATAILLALAALAALVGASGCARSDPNEDPVAPVRGTTASPASTSSSSSAAAEDRDEAARTATNRDTYLRLRNVEEYERFSRRLDRNGLPAFNIQPSEFDKKMALEMPGRFPENFYGIECFQPTFDLAPAGALPCVRTVRTESGYDSYFSLLYMGRKFLGEQRKDGAILPHETADGGGVSLWNIRIRKNADKQGHDTYFFASSGNPQLIAKPDALRAVDSLVSDMYIKMEMVKQEHAEAGMKVPTDMLLLPSDLKSLEAKNLKSYGL